MEKVAIRSPRKVICSAAKETFVARRREDVGPGVKMEVMRSVKKVAMAAGAWAVSGGIRGMGYCIRVSRRCVRCIVA